MSPNYQRLTPMLCVRNLDASVAFYERFGFGVAMREDHIALVILNHLRLFLFADSPQTPDKPGTHLVPQASSTRGNVILVLGVDDCRAAHDELVSRGVRFLTPPKKPPWGGWRCFARDPDGYLIEIEEAP